MELETKNRGAFQEGRNGGKCQVPSAGGRGQVTQRLTGIHLSSDKEIRGDQADLGPTWTHVKTCGKE